MLDFHTFLCTNIHTVVTYMLMLLCFYIELCNKSHCFGLKSPQVKEISCLCCRSVNIIPINHMPHNKCHTAPPTPPPVYQRCTALTFLCSSTPCMITCLTTHTSDCDAADANGRSSLWKRAKKESFICLFIYLCIFGSPLYSPTQADECTEATCDRGGRLTARRWSDAHWREVDFGKEPTGTMKSRSQELSLSDSRELDRSYDPLTGRITVPLWFLFWRKWKPDFGFQNKSLLCGNTSVATCSKWVSTIPNMFMWIFDQLFDFCII